MSVCCAEENSPKIRRKLDTVSPSLYGNLKLWKDGRFCPLQLLWRGKPLLAPYPAARLGDIVHKLMDKAHLAQSRSDLDKLWENASAEVENELCAHWTTRSLVPLSRKTKGYELKRQMTLRRVYKILDGRKDSAETSANPVKVLREKLIESKDGTLKGRVDLAEERPGGWVLTDFKSGELLEDDGDEKMRVKESYELQLLLYAHLFKEAKGITIKKAVLKTLDGKEYPVELNERSVNQAGTEARQLLQDLNNHIQEDSLPQDLCVPMPISCEEGVFGCAGCLFRPACKGYREEKKSVTPGKPWPRDAWGRIMSIKRSGGRVELEIQNNNDVRDEQGHRIEGILHVNLEDSTTRHPALDDLQEGHSIEIYEYLRCRSRGVAQDGARTCVYRSPTS